MNAYYLLNIEKITEDFGKLKNFYKHYNMPAMIPSLKTHSKKALDARGVDHKYLIFKIYRGGCLFLGFEEKNFLNVGHAVHFSNDWRDAIAHDVVFVSSSFDKKNLDNIKSMMSSSRRSTPIVVIDDFSNMREFWTWKR